MNCLNSLKNDKLGAHLSMNLSVFLNAPPSAIHDINTISYVLPRTVFQKISFAENMRTKKIKHRYLWYEK